MVTFFNFCCLYGRLELIYKLNFYIMKKKLFIFTLILLGISFSSKAHDFYEINGDGDTIYYNITSSTPLTVGVTFQSYSYGDTVSAYSGVINIPSTVPHGGIIYNVTSIDPYAFIMCNNLTSVTIPTTVTTIGVGAFIGCNSLNSITIPQSVTSIGADAFRACTSLPNMDISSVVTYIGDYAFNQCTSMTSINVDPQNPNYASNNGILYNKTLDTLICCPGGKSGALTIPNSVTNIYNYAISYCTGLTSVIIPNSVTSILNSAFSNCNSLTSISIPSSITLINDYTFASCSTLTLISLPNTITHIGKHSFAFCPSLDSIILPSSLISLDYASFWYSPNITAITCLATNPPSIIDNTFHPLPNTTPIYVPCNSIAQYQAATNWNYFTNILNDGTPIITNIIDSFLVGSTYNNYEFNETTAGTFTQNLQTANGCDSIVTLTLTTYTTQIPSNIISQVQSDNIQISWQGNSERYRIYRNEVLLASVSSNTFNDYDVEQSTEYCYEISAIVNDQETETSSPECVTFLKINEPNVKDIQVKLYPNPASNKTTLEITELRTDANVILYDMLGKELKTYSVKAKQDKLNIDLQDLNKGIYYIKISSQNHTSTKKIIVK